MKTISKEEILRLNCPGFGEQADLSIGKARPLESYKVLVVNPTSILHLFDGGSETLKAIDAAQTDGLTSFDVPSDDILNKLNDAVTLRTEELVKFLEAGGLLLFFLCRPFVLQGPSMAMDNYLWLLSLAPDKSAEKNSRNMSAAASGRNIETTAEASDSEFFHYFEQPGLEWTTVIRTDFLTEGYTALALAGPKKCVAAELYAGDNGGRIVFLPAPYSPDFDRSLVECANLWLNRKEDADLDINDIRKALEPGVVKTNEEERVRVSQVIAAKQELNSGEAALMSEKPSAERTATVPKPLPRPKEQMPASGVPLHNSMSRIPSMNPPRPPSSQSQSNLPARPSQSPVGAGKPPASPIQKTQSGLVVPKLDQSISLSKSAAAGTAGGVNATADRINAIDPRTVEAKANLSATQKPVIPPANGGTQEPPKAKVTYDKLPSALNANTNLSAASAESQAGQRPAPKPEMNSNRTLDLFKKADDAPPKTSGASAAENILKELEESTQKSAAEMTKTEEESSPKEAPPMEMLKTSHNRLEALMAPSAPAKPAAEPPAETTAPLAKESAAKEPTPKDPIKDSATKMDQVSKAGMPAWCQSYPFPGLDEFRRERSTLLEQIRTIQSKVNSIDDKLSTMESFKNSILVGDGLDLVNAVKKVLTKLGWTTQPSSSSDSELWLSIDGKPDAVAKIVRTNEQVARGDLAHLAESVITFWEEYEHDAKGILVASTWVNTSPSDRNEPDFPQAIHDFANKKNFCLVTTTQLLAAYRDVELGRAGAQEVRESISQASGILSGYSLDGSKKTS